ncbi:acyl-CoA--6-aminopenicillanic acid acyl-transferase [Enterococcus saigonensis]|uniref:Acyl-CoA--6-aminopenicillanic acid acyl-transferase n=1 Tax=Enterococcus saigonensis TaxID=1805431 RepID=A0A679IBZ0_9ENTE|nr:C45 family peptidase [Enterococcus saigonensis]BCA85763.1 acyl-CoA--6-aminopenicillanic acid acyl-transferase [Enterococcus saigonensis]
MKEVVTTYAMSLTGTNYEIGYQLGQEVLKQPALLALHKQKKTNFSPKELISAIRLFDQWCPGLTAELTGFADALNVTAHEIFFYSMTYLIPRCSQIVILPNRSADNIPLLARNYEFSAKSEDFCIMKTAVKGRYAHIGTSVLHFGRDEGLNEQGLAVSMSSSGFPVGALNYMRKPKFKGLQFWAVIRTLLENCRNVDEALTFLAEMPIAYNINLMLVDKSGKAALYETLDGRTQSQVIDAESFNQVLFATNHPLFASLRQIEPEITVHSAKRYEYIAKKLKNENKVSCAMLKEMLVANYPAGLCCHFFQEYFGTTKSMILSPTKREVEILWGGEVSNGWQKYSFEKSFTTDQRQIFYHNEKAPKGTFEWVNN